MSKTVDMIIQKASGKKAVLFSALFIVSIILINLIGSSGTPDGAAFLDFEFGHTPEKAYDMLTALEAEGRAFYLAVGIPLDFPFPVTYMLFCIACIALLLKHTVHRKPFRYIMLLPVLAMFFDWAENVGIIVMLRNYPDLPVWAVSTANIFGILKWSFLVASFTAAGVLFIVCLCLRYRKMR